MIRNFLAYELALKLYRKVEAMPLKHSIRDQLIRASQSIVLNLAEGSAKPTAKDKQTLDLIDHIAACLYKLTYPR